MGQSQSCTYGKRRRAVAVCSIDLRLQLCEALFLRSASTPHNRFSVRLMTARPERPPSSPAQKSSSPPTTKTSVIDLAPSTPRCRFLLGDPSDHVGFRSPAPSTLPARSVTLKRITRCSRAPPLLAVCPSDRGHPGPGRAVFISNLMSLKAR